MTEEHPTLLLGAYVLGALDPNEREDVDAHVADCPACAAELGELLPLREVLAQLGPDDLAELAELTEHAANPGTVAAPRVLFARMSAAIDADDARDDAVVTPIRRRRAFAGRSRLLAVAAAVVVVLAGAGVGIGAWASGGHHGSTFAATANGVHMSVHLNGTQSGTTVALTVDGLATNEHCTLVAVGPDGTRHPAGDWTATYTGSASFTGSTDVPRSQLRQLLLLGTTGDTLVTVAI
jgi:anti-sigma factor RsiW